jgi:hypothetical protein
MKDQYFGDVNDFRKYALLRALIIPDRLRLGVCWMLTEADGRTDGKLLSYLGKPATYRQHDAELFDWLKQVVEVEADRRTARMEASDLLGSASFQSRTLTDRENERNDYFSECSARFSDCDLVFFDPDNGLEVKSKRRGHKKSCKYLFWEEVCNTFAACSSVLIYQHFPRKEREQYIGKLSSELRERTRAATVFSFRTPNVLFLLASQERHAGAFRVRLAGIRSNWHPNQIRADEHLSIVAAKL